MGSWSKRLLLVACLAAALSAIPTDVRAGAVTARVGLDSRLEALLETDAPGQGETAKKRKNDKDSPNARRRRSAQKEAPTGDSGPSGHDRTSASEGAPTAKDGAEKRAEKRAQRKNEPSKTRTHGKHQKKMSDRERADTLGRLTEADLLPTVYSGRHATA